MPLTAGTRLGPYVIEAPIGAGGMGEVYRARDTNLQRDVAIKILPELFAGDPERLARFSREAQTLAALNHSNIAHIYGLEGTALVMELVDGDDLAQRLARGPIALEDALPLAKQIADALEAAHQQGIIHRDLKPANIKVRPDGTVKLLDFGLAKALGSLGGLRYEDGVAQGFSPANVMNSPTFTNAAMTNMGVILGTAAYMSPEQAKGKAVDKRADIWAFGCVLFEMLTGKMAFAGEDVTETLAAVVRGEPDWAALNADTPASVRRLLRRCLTRDVKERLSDIGVARLEIRDALDQPGSGEQAPVSRDPRRSKATWWISAVALLTGALATGLAAWTLWPTPRVLPTLSLTIDWPEGLTWQGPSGSGVAMSPDGTHLAYMAASAGEAPRLYVRSLNDDQSRVVPGSERAYSPFFSPNSAQVGFIAAGKLWRAPVGGGTPFEIGTVDPEDRGAAWSVDGYIYSGGGGGVFRIADAGGTRETLTSVNRAAGEVAHRFPAAVPDGRAILFTVFKGGLDDARIAVLDLTTRKWRVLMDRPGHSAHYTPTGHLVYLRTGVLMAAPFDLRRLEVTGPPAPVMNGVLYNAGGAAHFSIANTGMLVYVPDPGARTPTAMVWKDRTGRITPIETPSDAYDSPAISPDGTRVALERREPPAKSSVVVWDFGRRAFTPVTRDSALNRYPVWMPGGDSLIFTSHQQVGSVGHLFRQRADGAGNPTQVSTAQIEQTRGVSGEFPGSVSSDGARLFYAQSATASDGIKVLDLATGRIEPLVPSRATDPRISPDGQWLAYQSFESGTLEIYVRPYPAVTTARWPISNGGGRSPRWSRDGRELFYEGVGVNRSRMFVVTVDAGAAFRAVRPQVLFETGGSREDTPYITAHSDFDVAPDGRFLMLVATQSKPSIPHVIVNWFETLKRAVPR